MNKNRTNSGWWMMLGYVILSGLLLTGCVTYQPPRNTGDANTPSDGDKPSAVNPAIFRVGDSVKIEFADVPTLILPHEEEIKEDGTIHLPLIGAVVAVGRTAGQLQQEIHNLYVPKYYVRITVSVRPAERYYWVGGEVKLPGKQLFPQGGLTVIKAIQSAGDFTDFAKKTRVLVTRANGQNITVDCERALSDPGLDIPMFPGDRINVPRRVF